jgi:hypothetical protein
MKLVEVSLCRLRDNFRHLVVPLAAMGDVSTIEAQIELRRLILKDIELIRRQLRPYMVCKKKPPPNRRLRSRRISRARLIRSYRAERIRWSASPPN